MKQTKQLIEEEELQTGIAKGAYKAFVLAKAGYGPKAGNAMLEQPFGDPLLSRDGITNIRKFYDEDPIQNMAIRSIVQASSQSNKNGGDGTTATIILAFQLYTLARKLIAAGYNRMTVSKELQDEAERVVTQLTNLAEPFDTKLLKKIAEISSGSEAIGEMLTEIFQKLGMDAHVLVENYSGDGIYSEIVDGFYFNKGLQQLALANDPSNLESRHMDVPILIAEKPFRTAPDIAPVLEKIKIAGMNDLILIGEVGPEALDVILLSRMQGVMTVIPVEPPVYEGMRTLFLDDLALVTGGKVYNSTPEDFDTSMLGFAQKVIINGKSTTILGADGASEDVRMRISELKKQLNESTEEVDFNALKERIGRLSGQLAIIRVGAPTELEQKEVKLRMDDAVCAIQAAPKGGVLPGGGVALARVNAGRFSDAYKSLIKCLAENAGLNPERILSSVENAKDWYGFDFKNFSENPKDLLKAGILDPTLVVKEVVKNATSIACSLITASVGLTLVNREEKQS